MFYQILSLLLDVAAGLVGGACLLRLYMQYQRIPMSAHSGNPVGGFVFALTDWLVLPLRRVVPSAGRLDTASLLAAYLIELAQFGLLWLLAGAHTPLLAVLVLAFFGVFRLLLSLATGLLLVHVVLSWVATHSPMADLIDRLCAPALAPVRRIVPLVGRVDLSPLVLLLLLQVGAIVLAGVQTTVLQAL
ncbi:MAG TPA: YggT family protein [Burkholderiaceae bacterium]